MKPERILAIEVDGITCQPSKRGKKQVEKKFNELTYNTVQQAHRNPLQQWCKYTQAQINSKAHMYKCKELETVRFPGGTLKLAKHKEPPMHKELAWNVSEEPLEGHDDFKHNYCTHPIR